MVVKGRGLVMENKGGLVECGERGLVECGESVGCVCGRRVVCGEGGILVCDEGGGSGVWEGRVELFFEVLSHALLWRRWAGG